MFPANFINADRIRCQSKAASKKRILEEIGGLLASSFPELDEQKVFNKLLERERLGSTGVGQGIAIPHARIAGIQDACGAFLRLREGVKFDAMDNQPVDLVFGLIVPEDATQAHLELLAKLATLFSDEAFCNTLRAAENEEATLLRLSHMN